MKRWWFGALGSIAFFAFFFFLGRQSAAPTEEPSPPPPHASYPAAEPHAKETQKAFASSYTQAFAPSQLRAWQSRFQEPYPKKSGKFGALDREVMARLGILKGLARDNTYSPEAFSFFRGIAQNPKENWLVRRQALQNALAFSSSVAEAERGRLLASIPPGILHMAAKTEAELLEDFTSHARR